jgi:hypothetical protein
VHTRSILLAAATLLAFGPYGQAGAPNKSFDPGSSPYITLVLAPEVVDKYSINRVTSPGGKVDDGMSVSLWNSKDGSLVYTNLKVGDAAIKLTPGSTYYLYFWGNKDPKAFGARFNLTNTTATKPTAQGFFVGYDATTKATAGTKPVLVLDNPKSEVMDLHSPYPDNPADNGLIISKAGAKPK